MEISKKPWSMLSVCGYKNRIDTNPDFQRPAVWSLGQKQLLIDTILRGYDIPKLYWRKVSKSPEKYEVVDGQQRLRTIFEFHDGEFSLAKNADDIDGVVVTKMLYNDLPEDLRLRFDNYDLDVIVLSDTSEDEVREMFLRLQNGTSLKAQEKRNAMSGKMRDFVKDLAEHPFFLCCGFTNSRFTYDLISAQITAIELNGGPCHVRSSSLTNMYKTQSEFDSTSPKARKIRRVLEFLSQAFTEKTPELERYSVISLYGLVSHCLENTLLKVGRTICETGFYNLKLHVHNKRDSPWTRLTQNYSLTKSVQVIAQMLRIQYNGVTTTCLENFSRPFQTSNPRMSSACFRTNNALQYSVETEVSAKLA